MIKELIFKLKIKKADKMHIKQYLERKGYEIFYLDTDQGKALAEKLKVKIPDDDSIIYDTGRFRYVFVGCTSNEADELMLLLHECGHIEHNHKSISKYNEAEAWNFAYTVAELPRKMIKLLAMMLLAAIITCALMQPHIITKVQAPQYSQPDMVSDSTASETTDPDTPNQQSDVVYITKTGTRFHLADCYTIQGKSLREEMRNEAEKHYTPCKICRP